MAVKLVFLDLDKPDAMRVEGAGFGLKLADEQSCRQFGLVRASTYHPQIWEAAKYIFGRAPNEMWLNDPTSIKNVNEEFGGKGYEINQDWRPCQVRQTFHSARVLSQDAEPKAVYAVRHDNSDNSDEGEFNAGLNYSEENTAERSHGGHTTVGFALEISAEVGGEATQSKVGVKETWSFETGREWNTTKSNAVALSAGLGTVVKVKPHEEKRSVLYAAFGGAEVDVTYSMELVGDAYFYFRKALNGQHHHVVDVEELRRVMRDAYGLNAPATTLATERVSIGMFGDCYSRIEDV